MVLNFSLTEEQCKKFNEWSSKHEKVYTGAVGGRYTFEFCPTSIGDFVTVRDFITKETLDLSDVD